MITHIASFKLFFWGQQDACPYRLADTYMYGFGRFVHNGSFLKVAIEKGLINGSDLLQVGLRGEYPDNASLQWMREQKIKSHYMAAIEKKGWEAVLEEVMQEVDEGPEYWFISFDMNAMDPTYAPAVGSPEPNGLTTPVAFRMVRRLCAEKNIVGMEMVEYNPLRDPSWITGQLANRIVKEAMVGIALRKKGITEKDYESEMTKTHSGN